MKRAFTLITSFLLFLQFSVQGQADKAQTIQASVVVSKSPPSITISWPLNTAVSTGYNIYRKGKDDQSWGKVKATAKATDTVWTDTDVTIGTAYEYNILKMNGSSAIAITYLLSGIELPVVHKRGSVLVVVEKDLAATITTELNDYFADIAADGWKVFGLQVSKTDSVKFVKREIQRMDKIAGGFKSLIILGHVPVPYSGNFGNDASYPVPPDGHPDHVGCWPTDSYYAIDYDDWADTETNTVGSRAENKNLPGDSKFDNITFPNDVKYYLGRIDLSNMPKFVLTETELTKRYLKKAHDFRYKITQTVEKAVIDDNFSAGFSSTGWRNFSVIFGPKNIINDDFFTTCGTQNLLFAYGAGGGSFNSCSGIGVTNDFVTNKPAIFNMLFGSYFGDWDNTDNFLRAPLAAPENGLTNAWSGRPYWQNHSMAMGDPIGYSAMVSMNNTGLYTYNVFANVVSIELMGDPTLRLHMIEPPTNVTATDASNFTKVNLSWTASNEAGNLGYYIYRSSSPYGNYFVLNSTPQTATTFTDNTPFQGNNYYLVKTVKLTTSASGSYFNTSYGAKANISGILGQPAGTEKLIAQTLSVYPNPAKNSIVLKFAYYTNNSDIQIFNSKGQLVKEINSQLNNDFTTQSIPVSDLSQGLYFIKSGTASSKFIKE